MRSSPWFFVKSVLWHIRDLLLLRHNGKGLPTSPGLILTLSVCSVLSDVARGFVRNAQMPTGTTFLSALLICTLLLLAIRFATGRARALFGGLVLLFLGTNCVEIIAYSISGPQSVWCTGVSIASLVWPLVGYHRIMTTLNKK